MKGGKYRINWPSDGSGTRFENKKKMQSGKLIINGGPVAPTPHPNQGRLNKTVISPAYPGAASQ